MRLYHLLLTLIVTTPALAAQGQPSPASVTPEPAALISPVFDCYHINYAWGFNLSGRFIDRDGTVYTYTRPRKAWMAHEIHERGVDYLLDADLQTKLSARTRIGSVDPAQLAQKVALIEAASNGKILPIDGGARDAGSSSCHAYVRDAAKGRYRDIALGSDHGLSDVRIKNDSPAAQALLQWLGTIGPSR